MNCCEVPTHAKRRGQWYCLDTMGLEAWCWGYCTCFDWNEI